MWGSGTLDKVKL